MPTLQTENKPLDAKLMASEIINAAIEETVVSISGTANQKLTTVVRYLNRDKISARGERWFQKNLESLTTDAVETLVTAREKAITDYQNKKEVQAKDELFRTLRARGIDVVQAEKEAYGN